MQAQTTKKMMALVRCLSPLRWFQYKEQLSVTLTNLLMMKKKKITGIQLTVLVLFLAVQKEKKKKEPCFQLAQLHLFQETHQQTIWIKLYQERQSQYIKRSLIFNRMKHFYRYTCIFSLIFHCRYHVYWTLWD